jgi:hypothetical protein
MTASRLAFLEMPFVITPEDIQKLHSTFNDLVAPPEWTVSFSDGLDRKYSNLSDVLSIENSPKRRVRSIQIRSRQSERSISASLTLGSGDSNNVTINLEGPEEVAVKLNEQIQDRLEAMRPWYAGVARSDFFGLIFTAFVILAVAGLAAIFFIPTEVANRPVSSEREAKLTAAAYLALAALGAVAWLLNKLRARLFPKATFAIGQGHAHHRHLENIRWAVVIGFLVSVAASAFLALF